MADNEKKAEKTAAEATEQKPKKKSGKLLFIILPVVGAAAGVVATMALPKPNQKAEAKQELPEQYADFAIPEIKANLARSGGLHFVGVEITIKIKSHEIDHVAHRLGIVAESGGGEGHGGGGKPKDIPQIGPQFVSAVRDRIILLFNSKSIDDLEGREKKELLKREIKTELEQLLFPEKDAEVEAVLFKDLLIQ